MKVDAENMVSMRSGTSLGESLLMYSLFLLLFGAYTILFAVAEFALQWVNMAVYGFVGAVFLWGLRSKFKEIMSHEGAIE